MSGMGGNAGMDGMPAIWGRATVQQEPLDSSSYAAQLRSDSRCEFSLHLADHAEVVVIS